MENLFHTPVLGSPVDFDSFEPPFLSGAKEKVLHLTAFSATVRILQQRTGAKFK